MNAWFEVALMDPVLNLKHRERALDDTINIYVRILVQHHWGVVHGSRGWYVVPLWYWLLVGALHSCSLCNTKKSEILLCVSASFYLGDALGDRRRRVCPTQARGFDGVDGQPSAREEKKKKYKGILISPHHYNYYYSVLFCILSKIDNKY